MCKHGTLKKVNVIRRANSFIEDGWHEIHVDACIADIVQTINDLGIISVQSCCGHGEQRGYVWIAHKSIANARELGYPVEMVDFSHKLIYWTEHKRSRNIKMEDMIDYRIEPFIYIDKLNIKDKS